MLQSMTAFARSESCGETLEVVVELRSVNSRHLDISLRVPEAFLNLEEKIKGILSDRLKRGRIDVKVKIRNETPESSAFEINKPLAEGYYRALEELKDHLQIQPGVALDLVARVGGIIRPVEVKRSVETDWFDISSCLNRAVDDLIEMRQREGTIIAEDLLDRIDFIKNQTNKIELEASGLPELYQERLKRRMLALTKGVIELEPDRIVQEAALLADRSDISEEIVRVRSHIQQFHFIMTSEADAGRKLNFLLQEFGREFNTMGSKVGLANLSHMIVDVKSELEKIREQVQNIA
jgi:uncharacterized protein (TIGR00255 family)